MLTNLGSMDIDGMFKMLNVLAQGAVPTPFSLVDLQEFLSSLSDRIELSEGTYRLRGD